MAAIASPLPLPSATSATVRNSAGSFLRLGEDNFAGTVLIKTEALTLSAIGAYGAVHDRTGDQTSLFVYAVLDYPPGGPSFFFVTGLAAGFGYNRSLEMPEIEDLQTFPLIAEATAGLDCQRT